MSEPRLTVKVRVRGEALAAAVQPDAPTVVPSYTVVPANPTVSPPVADPPRLASRARDVERPSRSRLRRTVVLGGFGVLVLVNLIGLPYYLLPIAARVRHPLHVWLKPTGHIGQCAGILAFAVFVFMYLYPLRKRFRVLRFTGSLNRWLDVHIVFGLAIPVLGAIHAAWRFNGLIGLGYFSMIMVSLSGIVGKYLYAHIPHGRSGLEMSLEEVGARSRELIQRIAAATGIEPARIESILNSCIAGRSKPGIWATLAGLITSDFTRWNFTRKIRREWAAGSVGQTAVDRATLTTVIGLARRQIALTQQVRMLDATQRVFRFWHVAHRPFAITAFFAVLVHVVVAVTLGVTWLW